MAKDGRFGQFAYVAKSSARAARDKATAMANRGGVHAANPNPIDKWDQAGIGDAEFLPLCIAAGCSPDDKEKVLKNGPLKHFATHHSVREAVH